MIYLDGHATTPLDPRVFRAMEPYFFKHFGNASSSAHRMNWDAEAAITLARTQLAECLGAHEREIYFTSGATESNHIAILGLEQSLRESGRTRILSVPIEHASVLGPFELMERKGFQVEWIQLDPQGRVDLDDLKRKLNDHVGLVSIAHANHEIGTIQDLAKISEITHAVGALLHTDAVQSFGKLKLNVSELGIDLLSISAHKIYGPKGVGALYVRRKNPRVDLKPIFLGGAQESGLRPGTPNTPGIVGLAQAALLSIEEMDTEQPRLVKLRDHFWSGLKERLPCVIRNGAQDHALPHNLNISFQGVDGAALLGRLKNIAVSNASACLNRNQNYSQVLSVLGVSKKQAQATLRFGLGRFTTEAEIDAAILEIEAVVLDLRKLELEFANQAGIDIMKDCGEKA